MKSTTMGISAVYAGKKQEKHRLWVRLIYTPYIGYYLVTEEDKA
jgi:hypothetical protein